jgi:hypothetical protein
MENKLIMILIVVIGAIAISQLVRVYELTAKLRKHGEHEIPVWRVHLFDDEVRLDW